MEMLRGDDAFFQKFGQVYLSVAYPGVVKGWHYHKLQTDHFVIVKGMMKVVLYDGREDSPTKGEVNEFFMGEKNPILLVIPPGVCARHEGHRHASRPCWSTRRPSPTTTRSRTSSGSDPHDNDIPYDWSRKDG